MEIIKNKTIINNSKATAIIITLFFSNVIKGFLFNVSSNSSPILSIDKIIKVGLILLFAINFLYIATKSRKEIRASKAIKKIHFSLFILCGIAIANILLSNTHSEYFFTYSKETNRILIFSVVTLLFSLVPHRTATLKYIFQLMALLSIWVASNAVIYSKTASIDKHWRMIEGFVRAGDQIYDPNMIGALLSAGSFFCIVLAMQANTKKIKTIYILFFFISQMGRLYTFSTGSHINTFVTALVFAALLLKKKIIDKKLLFFLLLSLIVGITYFLNTETGNLLTYRIRFADDRIVDSSINSRLIQYERAFKYFSDSPQKLISGVNPVNLHDDIIRIDFHNSYLRSLFVTGILGFVSYCYLNYFAFINFKHLIAKKKTSLFGAGLLSTFVGWQIQSLTLPADTSAMQWFFIMTAVISHKLNLLKSTHINK